MFTILPPCLGLGVYVCVGVAFRISGEVAFRINGEMMKGYRQRSEKIRYAYKNIQNIEYRGMAWPCPETLKERLS